MGPLLEMESGSNDPTSYMITIILIGMFSTNGLSFGMVLLTFVLQVSGLAVGALIGYLGTKVINKIKIRNRWTIYYIRYWDDVFYHLDYLSF